MKRHVGLGIALLLIAAAIFALERPWETGSSVPPSPSDLPAHLAGLPGAADFGGATDWINTNDASGVDLVAERGNVVLVDFWTYSCINCIRTFPYLRAWQEAYGDRGLVIVGVHSPEFRFERDVDNVREAAQRHGLDYAIAIDNDYDVWDAYNNRFWPTKHLVDQYGKIRYTRIGEGAYETTEERIRGLLAEAGHDPGPYSNATPESDASDPGRRTPELYAAGSRSAIGNPQGYQAGRTVNYSAPEDPARDRIYLDGAWHAESDHMRAEGSGRIVLRYTAGQADFVAAGADGACVPITLDGGPVPEEISGSDVVRNGNQTCVALDGARAYFYHEGTDGEHLLEIEVPAGFELYSFAFSDRKES